MKKICFVAAAICLLLGTSDGFAQVSITQLPNATTPLNGTEVVPGVQNGQTVQIPETALGVQGPGSATTGDLPSFNGTSGRILQDSGVLGSTVVVGPSSATASHLAAFNGATGKLIQDSGAAISSLAPLVSPVFTTPTLGVAAATSVNFGGSTLGTYSKTTPTVSLAFGGLSVGIGYTTRVTTCTQIGDVATCNIDLLLSSKGSSSGAASISGLPLSATTGGSSACSVVPATFASSLTTQMIAYIQSNTSVVILDKMAAGSTSAVADTDFNNTSEIIVTCAYHVVGS